MALVSQKESQVNTPSFWVELYAIFLFYIKIFLATIGLGSIFFFLYAGIKTGNIPLDVVAISFAALATLITVIVGSYYITKASYFFRPKNRHSEKTKDDLEENVRSQQIKELVGVIEKLSISSAVPVIRILLFLFVAKNLFADILAGVAFFKAKNRD